MTLEDFLKNLSLDKALTKKQIKPLRQDYTEICEANLAERLGSILSALQNAQLTSNTLIEQVFSLSRLSIVDEQINALSANNLLNPANLDWVLMREESELFETLFNHALTSGNLSQTCLDTISNEVFSPIRVELLSTLEGLGRLDNAVCASILNHANPLWLLDAFQLVVECEKVENFQTETLVPMGEFINTPLVGALLDLFEVDNQDLYITASASLSSVKKIETFVQSLVNEPELDETKADSEDELSDEGELYIDVAGINQHLMTLAASISGQADTQAFFALKKLLSMPLFEELSLNMAEITDRFMDSPGAKQHRLDLIVGERSLFSASESVLSQVTPEPENSSSCLPK